MSENKEMIERMQENGKGLAWLSDDEIKCLETNWKLVEMITHQGEWSETQDEDIRGFRGCIILRISPDWKPDPVTSDLHAEVLARLTATRDNLIKTLNNDIEAVLKMIKEQA